MNTDGGKARGEDKPGDARAYDADRAREGLRRGVVEVDGHAWVLSGGEQRHDRSADSY